MIDSVFTSESSNSTMTFCGDAFMGFTYQPSASNLNTSYSNTPYLILLILTLLINHLEVSQIMIY